MISEKMRAHLRKIGKLGGENGAGKPKGFASMPPDKHKAASALGGKNKAKRLDK